VVPAIRLVAPLLLFLATALTLAALVERSGLADRAASSLATSARGSGIALYALVCALCAVLTAIVSLDGAVVLIVPVLLTLERRVAASLPPLFLGVVVVANAASIAVPQGNPTNLVVINRLAVSPEAFIVHMLPAGLAAAALCAAGVALSERRTLATPYQRPAGKPGHIPLSRAERHASLALIGAALAAWVAPLAGLAPWWPFSAAVAIALAARHERPRLIVPWRIGAQVGGLLIVITALGLHTPAQSPLGLPGLMLVAAGIGVAAALANNLPVSVSAATLLAAGPSAYAASIGLAVGPLATPHGSVATLIATDLAGPNAPRLPVLRLLALGTLGLLAATVLLWVTL
jgi:arsenical pump membrane protein